MSEAQLQDYLDTRFSFSATPYPVPADLRPLWRMALVVLMLDKCWGRRSSVGQLHVFNWGIRTKGSQDAFLRMLGGEIGPDKPIVRFEPSLNRAIDFALGEGLVKKRTHDVIELTEKGVVMARQVQQAPELLGAEKEFLSKIEGKLTQQQINALLRWER
jgi:hypothetical protein